VDLENKCIIVHLMEDCYDEFLCSDTFSGDDSGRDENEYYRQRNSDGHISIDAVNIRDYSGNKHGR
jgi:hypothetical protein